MSRLHRKLRAAAGLSQPGLIYVGGNQGSVVGTNPVLALNALTGGMASAAAAGDLVIGAIACLTSNAGNLYTQGTWDASQGGYKSAAAPHLMCAAFSKRLAAADASIQFSANFSIGHAYMIEVYRRSNAATPIDVASTSWNDTSGPPNPPAITTATPGAMLIAIGAAATNTDLTIPGADYGAFIHESGITGLRLAMAARNTGAPGSYNPPAFGGGAADRAAAFTIAIRPE